MVENQGQKINIHWGGRPSALPPPMASAAARPPRPIAPTRRSLVVPPWCS